MIAETRIRLELFLTLVLASGAVLASSLPTMAQSPSMTTEELSVGSRQGYSVTAGGESDPGICLRVPMPVTHPEIRRYTTLLHLSEAQQQYLAGLFDDYRKSCDQIEQRMLSQLKPLVAKHVDNQDQSKKWTSYVEIIRLSKSMIEDLKKPEQVFFSRFTDVLSDTQREVLPRVLMHRARMRCSDLDRQLPMAVLDFARMIEAAGLTEEELAALDPILIEYEQAVTPAMTALDRRVSDDEENMAVLLSLMMVDDDGKPITQAGQPRTKATAAGKKRQEILAEEFPIQNRIAEINRRYLPKILDSLPQPKRDKVREVWMTQMYGNLWLDNAKPQPVYDAVIASTLLPQDLRPAIEEAWTKYLKEYDAIRYQICDRRDKWSEGTAQSHGYNAVEYAGYQEAIRQLVEQRIRLNESIANRLMNMSPADLQVKIKPLVGRVAYYAKFLHYQMNNDYWPGP